MIKACIFDLDGTLINSIYDLADACNKMLNDYGFLTHSIEAYEQFVGNGVRKLVERALPSEYQSDMWINLALQKFNEYYASCLFDKTTIYEGILDVLSYLQNSGIKLAVVTNKPSAFAIEIVENLFDCFEYVYGQQEDVPVKPNPYFVNKLLKQWQLTPDQALYIGDSDVDIFTGRNANMKTIGCCWGNRTKEELVKASATMIAPLPIDLIKRIEELNNDCGK